jgi:putative endonuclease
VTDQPLEPSATPHTSPRITLGQAGELFTAAWYAGEGYEILERNWRTRHGEIDLICSKGNLLVFCEVKTRHTDRMGAPVEAVTRSKQIRIRRLAAEFLNGHTCGGHDVRFDVAALLGSPGQLALQIIENAF